MQCLPCFPSTPFWYLTSEQLQHLMLTLAHPNPPSSLPPTLQSQTWNPWKCLKFDQSRAAWHDKTHLRQRSSLLSRIKGLIFTYKRLYLSCGLVFYSLFSLSFFYLVCGLFFKASVRIQGLYSSYSITEIANIKSLWGCHCNNKRDAFVSQSFWSWHF